VPRPRLRSYVEQVVDACCTGAIGPDAHADRAPVAWSTGRAAIALAQQQLGDEAALAITEAAIAAHPSMAGLWLERARLMLQLRIGRRGLDEARRMLAYVDDPDLVVAFTIMAAENRAVVPADFERLAGLPQPTLQSIDGKYARGLCALRRGDADKAEPLLAEAGDRGEGFALYARAMANLILSAPDARARAAELFRTLQQRYPSSSLSRNAGSFALQLAPN
jgi:tetratricopeptide (TPR) repeat protein